MPSNATGLSAPLPLERPTRAVARLARSSLCVAIVGCATTGCLVTSTPEFESLRPEQSAPSLRAQDADPPLGTLVTIEQGEIEEIFRASVVSEDGGESIKVALIVNYGVENASTGTPYYDATISTGEVAPATLADGPRPVSAELPVTTRMPDAPGCYTVTMMVSHDFPPGTACPSNISDSDELTWLVLRRCKEDGQSCVTGIDPEVDCPVAGARCQ